MSGIISHAGAPVLLARGILFLPNARTGGQRPLDNLFEISLEYQANRAADSGEKSAPISA